MLSKTLIEHDSLMTRLEALRKSRGLVASGVSGT